MFKTVAGGLKIGHVPYKGTAPALVDLMGGTVDVFFDNLSSSMTQHRSGKIRLLAVADGHRSPALPDVPTFAEAGLAGMNSVTWFAVMAPPATPDSVVRATNKALADALALPDVKHKFAEQGAEPRGWSPEETTRFAHAEADRWGKVIKAAKVKMD
jgi:tripartite-type tricarboxylate transporter receptor subunit TctC